METSELVKQIKRSFRLYMNGVTAASMRCKGLEYKVNWGVSQPDLRRMAMQYGKDSALADALWNEQGVRECRLLATLIMPSDMMSEEMAMRWANDITSAELAEMLAFNLFQHLKFGYTLVGQLLDKDDVSRICAYNLMCRLFKRGEQPDMETLDKLLAVASVDINTVDRQLLHSLINCLQCAEQINTEKALEVRQLLNNNGFDAF